MMTEQQCLLAIGMEECDELSQRLSKVLRFGPCEVQEFQTLDNRQRILRERDDLLAVLEMLGLLDGVEICGIATRDRMAAKQAKVRRWMQHSRDNGQVER